MATRTRDVPVVEERPDVLGAAQDVPRPARPDGPDPNHHLWRNGRLWWIAFTIHRGHLQERLRFSLRTPDVAEARLRRDAVLARYAAATDCRIAIRIEPRRSARTSAENDARVRRRASEAPARPGSRFGLGPRTDGWLPPASSTAAPASASPAAGPSAAFRTRRARRGATASPTRPTSSASAARSSSACAIARTDPAVAGRLPPIHRKEEIPCSTEEPS